MADETVPPIHTRAAGGAGVRTLLGPAAIAALAGTFAWTAPERNAWAAAALAGALALAGLARIAGVLIARRGGHVPRIGVRSLVLPQRSGTDLAAALFATALAVWPTQFPPLASGLAGLIAMGAIARLALVRVVLAKPELAKPEAPEA